jgi:hypothetical protein
VLARNLNRSPFRKTLRHTTRMLGGVRRPAPPNYLALACQALAEVIKIDERMRPHLDQQVENLKRWRRSVELQALLDKVYGDEGQPSSCRPLNETDYRSDREKAAERLKQETALAKSRSIIDKINAKFKIR